MRISGGVSALRVTTYSEKVVQPSGWTTFRKVNFPRQRLSAAPTLWTPLRGSACHGPTARSHGRQRISATCRIGCTIGRRPRGWRRPASGLAQKVAWPAPFPESPPPASSFFLSWRGLRRAGLGAVFTNSCSLPSYYGIRRAWPPRPSISGWPSAS